MKAWIAVLMIATLVASGCSKKDDELAVSPTPGTSVQPSTGASASPGATAGAGGASTSPQSSATPGTNAGAGTATAAPSKITKEQVEKISMTGTYDEMVKQTGSKGRLVKDENGKKTYEFEISNQPGYYAEIVFFNDGKISEKRVFQK